MRKRFPGIEIWNYQFVEPGWKPPDDRAWYEIRVGEKAIPHNGARSPFVDHIWTQDHIEVIADHLQSFIDSDKVEEKVKERARTETRTDARTRLVKVEVR